MQLHHLQQLMLTLTVKIGVDYGDALVVLYGKSLQNAHIDLISSSMGITAKVASFAQPNEIVVGQSIYNIFCLAIDF